MNVEIGGCPIIHTSSAKGAVKILEAQPFVGRDGMLQVNPSCDPMILVPWPSHEL